MKNYDKLNNMPQWAEGAAACAGGMLDSFNPYEIGSLEFKAWALGYKDAEECDDALANCPRCGRIGTRVDYHGAGKRCTACQTLS